VTRARCWLRRSFLNKLSLPPADREMTAYETGQRIQEYIRNALPLFEPMEMEYNGALCEDTFEALMRVGAFGSPQDIPGEHPWGRDSLSLREPVARGDRTPQGHDVPGGQAAHPRGD